MGIDFATKYFTCPYCGNGMFRCYPQTVIVGAKVQTWEYTCTKCNKTMALVVENQGAEDGRLDSAEEC